MLSFLNCPCQRNFFMQYHVELSVENISGKDSPIQESQWHDWFSQWLNSLDLDLEVDKVYEINLRLTNDEEIQSLNKQFRHLDKPTDVLSFAALEDDCPFIDELEAIVLGDIIISIDTAEKQAQLENHSLTIELTWLTTHGLLHLLGWDHPDDESLREMLTLQSELLTFINIQPPSLKQYFS